MKQGGRHVSKTTVGKIAALVVAALVAGCAGGGAPASTASSGPVAAQPLRSSLPRGAAGASAAAAAALDSLGAALLRRLPVGGNTVLSPYSIYTVLAMARAGAKGETAAQLDALLGGAAAAQAGNVTAIDKAVSAALLAGRPVPQNDPNSVDARPVTVDVANSVWLSPSLAVRPAYLDALATGFGVGLNQIDYAKDPEAARAAINSWVAGHTNKLIAELIQKGTITKDTVLTLVNALYLSAPWAKEFIKSDTPIAFTTGAGSRRSAPGMTSTAVMVASSGKGWTSVTIPYRGGGLAMTLVLPDAGSFQAVRAELPRVLQAANSATTEGPITVTMPTFKAQAHLSLVPAMKALGVTDIFQDNKADLSGIAGDPGYLFATELVHQAVITVDEKGTEAAAATAMMMEPASGMASMTQITVDRPFFYSVHDTTTGAPLFLGQITDPTALG